MAVTITKYDTRKVNSETITVETVDCINIDNVVNNFILWMRDPVVDTFDIADDKLDIAVIVTHYNNIIDDIKYNVIDLSYKFNDNYCCNKYQIKRNLSNLDIDNISDIVSLFCKVSTTDKALLKSKNINALINQHMMISNFVE